jgi:hypothetical protein
MIKDYLGLTFAFKTRVSRFLNYFFFALFTKSTRLVTFSFNKRNLCTYCFLVKARNFSDSFTSTNATLLRDWKVFDTNVFFALFCNQG